MDKKTKIEKLRCILEEIYAKEKQKLLFHGWHHIVFVVKKALEFWKTIQADEFIVESAAYVHDLNYLVKDNSGPEAGESYRKDILEKCGYTQEEIQQIEIVIQESHMKTRDTDISPEWKALSDGDNLFKALPITPILFAGNYIKECSVDIEELSQKIVREQNALYESGLYFYTDLARSKYMNWAETNLKLWNNVSGSLADSEIRKMLEMAKENEVI